MSDWDITPEEYQQEWNSWQEEYKITDSFIEFSDENWEKVQAMDPHYVWTNHSTCEDEKVTAGAKLFKNSCCWDTFGWYIAEVPWVGDPETFFESIDASAYLPCTTCNADGEDDNIDEECQECEGEGFVHHYFD